jgi:two-component system cell cycle response regulator
MAKKVLIIDDSITQLSSLKIFFKRAGFDVETAQNGVEGFVKVYKTAPDLIISDVLMPHLGGFQLCRLLKSNPETKQIPIIMLTVLDKKLDKFWASQSGANRFIQKDSDFKNIIQIADEISNEFPVSQRYKDSLKTYEFDEEGIIPQINKILDDELMKATISNKFRDLTDYTSDDKVIAGRIFKILSTILEYDAACIYFHSPDGSTKKRLIFDKQNCELKDNVYLDIWRQILPDCIEDFEIETVNKNKSENIIESADEFQSRKEFDFYYENNLIGKVCFYSTQNIEWNKLKFMPSAKSELDLYLRLKFLYVKTCYLSITDELTKLYTRRHLDSVIIQEFERAKRYGTIISVAMADIDNFKMINDTYGHTAGDYILKEVSKIFIDTLRKTDFIYRYGGEEICILMPETCIQNVIMPLERIRKNIENKQFIHNNQQIKVTISVGATTYAKDMRVPSDLIEKADAALYKAKKTGKNKVVIENE